MFFVSRIFRVIHSRESKNPKELTVKIGEVLEVNCNLFLNSVSYSSVFSWHCNFPPFAVSDCYIRLLFADIIALNKDLLRNCVVLKCAEVVS